MGVARDLVDLETRLRDRADVDLFSPIERGGLLSSAEAASMVTRIGSLGSLDPAAVLRLSLQSLRIQHDEMIPRLLEAEFVATVPAEMPGLARPTERVVREMIEEATKEIILLGYEFTDLEMVHLLADSVSRGVGVIIICDRGRGSAKRIQDAWPSGTIRPRLFHDKERAEGAPYASMHAKCLLSDGADLLVTSANFTFHGFHGNIEIGVRLSGPPAEEARKIFSYLVEQRIVEELQ